MGAGDAKLTEFFGEEALQGHRREYVDPGIDVAVAQHFGVEEMPLAGGIFTALRSGHGGDGIRLAGCGKQPNFPLCSGTGGIRAADA